MKFLVPTLICLANLLWTHAVLAGDVANAAKKGDVETLRTLLVEGAPVEEPGIASPLYFASQSGHTDAVQLLLEHNANPNAVSRLGTPLMIASRRKHAETVSLLLASGADPNLAGGEDERTPLHEAAYIGAANVVTILLENGADPLARTRFQEPPLHEAVKKERDDVVALLRARTRWTPPVPPTQSDISQADMETGRIATLECTGCHALEMGKAKEGPTLWAVVGRPQAGLEGYPYSDAMRSANGVWDVATLDAFLSDPMMAVPGTRMDRAQVTDQTTRWAMIAYLNSLK